MRSPSRHAAPTSQPGTRDEARLAESEPAAIGDEHLFERQALRPGNLQRHARRRVGLQKKQAPCAPHRRAAPPAAVRCPPHAAGSAAQRGRETARCRRRPGARPPRRAAGSPSPGCGPSVPRRRRACCGRRRWRRRGRRRSPTSARRAAHPPARRRQTGQPRHRRVRRRWNSRGCPAARRRNSPRRRCRRGAAASRRSWWPWRCRARHIQPLLAAGRRRRRCGRPPPPRGPRHAGGQHRPADQAGRPRQQHAQTPSSCRAHPGWFQALSAHQPGVVRIAGRPRRELHGAGSFGQTCGRIEAHRPRPTPRGTTERRDGNECLG